MRRKSVVRRPNRRLKAAALAPVAAWALLGLVGCGGRKGTSNSQLIPGVNAPTTTPTPTATATPTPTATPPGVTNPGAFIADSIVFVSASSPSVALLGSGGNSSSTLTFEVRNQLGQPLAGTCVSFTLANGGLGGGELINPAEAPATNCTQVTNASGQITTIFRAGTVPGTVSVIAFLDADGSLTANGTEIQTTATVGITSGPPSGGSFTVAAENPIVGNILSGDGSVFRIGETNQITATLSDRFTNSVPDGTTVTFQSLDPFGLTNTFSIQGSGATAGGNSQVQVNLTSLEPAPTDGVVEAIGTAQGGADSTVFSLLRRTGGGLFAGTDGGGIFRSLDNGVTWTRAGTPDTGLFNGIVYELVQNPADPNEIFAATAEGIYSSVTGVNWRRADGNRRVVNEQPTNTCGGGFNGACTIWDLSSGTFGDARTFVTAAGATRWDFTRSTSPVNGGTRLTFAAPASEVVVSYDNSNALPTGFETRTLIADPTVVVAPARLYAGLLGAGVYRSNDGGNRWVPINAGLLNDNVKALAFDSVNGRLYAGTEGAGVFRCDNPTAATPTWIAVNGAGGTALLDQNVNALVGSVGTATICAGTQTAGVQCSIDGGATWPVPASDAFRAANDTQVTKLYSPGLNQFVAVTIDDENPNVAKGNVWLSTAGIPDFSAAAAAGTPNRFYSAVFQNGPEILVGGRGRSVSRSLDTGATFTPINGTAPTELTNVIFDGVSVVYGGTTSIADVRQVGGDTMPLTPGQSATFRVLVTESAHNRPLEPNSEILISEQYAFPDPQVITSGTGTVRLPNTIVAGRNITDFYFTVNNNAAIVDNNTVRVVFDISSPNGNARFIVSLATIST